MGTRLLILLALIGAGLTVPPAAADAAERRIPPRFFGVMWDNKVSEASDAVQQRQWASMAVNGVESSRAVFSWGQAQPEGPGTTNYQFTDAIVRNAVSHGIDVLPVVTFTPYWARADRDRSSSAPADPNAYADYLELLIARYGPKGQFWKENPALPFRPIRHWQIWNEPHLHWQWTPQKDWEEKYGKLLRVAYSAAKQADPGAKVVLAGLANDSFRLLERMYKRGRIKGYFDIAAIHYYETNSYEFVLISQLVRKTLARRGGRRIPIWWTEAGASASRGRIREDTARHFQTTDRGMARHLTRTYKYLVRNRRKLRIQRVYWYTWASTYRRSGGAFDYSGLSVFNGQRTRAKPALSAYRTLARRLQGCRKDRQARCVRR